MKLDALLAVIDRFSRRRVTVLGDLVVDEYVYGRTHRVSREAPVLVVRTTERELRPGGAANAAANLAALGARVAVVGVVGRDPLGTELRRLLRARGIGVSGVVAAERITASKTRILAGDLHTTRQQMLRLDRETGAPLSPELEEAVAAKLARALERSDGLLLSDYSDGVITSPLVAASQRAARAGLTVCADSRHNIGDYRGIPWVTPNEPEAAAALGTVIESDADVRRAGRRLLRLTGGEGVLLTRGAQGVALICPRRPLVLLPAYGGVEVADVTGAGDTVAAIFLLALCCGAEPLVAAVLANLGGGLVVAKRGTATIASAELRAAATEWVREHGR